MSHASHWREECEKAHARIDELKRENAALRADAADWKARFEGKVAYMRETESHSADCVSRDPLAMECVQPDAGGSACKCCQRRWGRAYVNGLEGHRAGGGGDHA